MAKNNPSSSAAAFLQKATTTSPLSEGFKESFETTKPAVMSGFRGMFGAVELTDNEKEVVAGILAAHWQEEGQNKGKIDSDNGALCQLTAEIKAINNQSILLHGERIKKAQEILKSYREGAFSSWLYAAYGNRQTPYSMLQYYEFYCALPAPLKPIADKLPKKAVYALAAREGDLALKIEVVRSYSGQKQRALIAHIQDLFPLPSHDKRGHERKSAEALIEEIKALILKLEKKEPPLNAQHTESIELLIRRLKKLKPPCS